LGQTWKRTGKGNTNGDKEAGKQVKGVIEGDVDDYVINAGDVMFVYGFMYNKFNMSSSSL